MDRTPVKTEMLVLTVKVEPDEDCPLALIDEEKFDTHSDQLALTTNRSPEIEPRSQIPTVLTYGRIDFERTENSSGYKLKCNQCDLKTSIEDWKKFVEHIESEHKPNVSEEIELDINNKVNEDESGLENNNNDALDSNCDENNSYSDDSDEYEPKTKRTRKFSSKNISFGRSEKETVLGFLELLKAHAILWHPRRHIKKRFDEEINKLTKEFNMKFPKYQLTEEQMAESISRIKYYYQRITDEKHKRHIRDDAVKLKYSEYLKLCEDIETKSRIVKIKCNVCGVSFLDDVDLQIHSYQAHGIGELPYKCSRCGRGFTKAYRLAYHEKQHGNETFKCLYCPRTFDQEAKLKVHSRMHTHKQICEICGKQFENAYRYKRHKLHHEPPKEKCEICGKMLYEKYTLSEHMKGHRNERQYMCSICNKTFNHQNGLAIHRRSVHKITTQYVWAAKTDTKT